MDGEGVPVDYKKASELYDKALSLAKKGCELGNVKGCDLYKMIKDEMKK